MRGSWSESLSDLSSGSSDDDDKCDMLQSELKVTLCPPSVAEVNEILANLDIGFGHGLLEASRSLHRSQSNGFVPSPLPSPSPPVRETSSAKSQRRGRRKYINQYLLLDELGKGAFGSVRVANNVTDHENYAIKTVNKSILRRKRQLRRGKQPTNMLENVFREIAIMKKLDHPNVVHLIEVIDDPLSDKMHLVLELVGDGAIAKGRESARMDPIEDPETIRKYFRDMLLGVDYLHRQNIVHCDIKPANLLKGEDGSLKLGDFGVSLTIEADAVDNSLVTKVQGTPAFLAPEASDGGKFNAFGVDTWAMGVTLYMFCTGVCPFAGHTLIETFDKIAEYDPPMPDVDPRLQDVLRRLLIKDPKNRITVPELMCHSWVTNDGRDELKQSSFSPIEVNAEEVADAVQIMKLVANVVSSVKKNLGRRSSRSTSRSNQPPESMKRRRSLKRLRQVFSSVVDRKHRHRSPRRTDDTMRDSADEDEDSDSPPVLRPQRLSQARSEPTRQSLDSKFATERAPSPSPRLAAAAPHKARCLPRLIRVRRQSRNEAGSSFNPDRPDSPTVI